MATVLSKGVIVPDPGETDWAGYLAINWGKLNDVVGAALPDAQNVWTQPQIFQNNAYLTNTSYTVGTIPTSNITATLFFAGASNYQIGYCRGVVYRTTGQTSAELTARNKFTNGVLDPAGSYINATFTVNLDADGTRWIQFANSSIKNGLIPYATDTYNIGSAANQWLRLFAKFYYYNGTAWGLDQANTWTGYNTFTSYIALQESAVIPAGGYGKGIAFRDYQNNRLGYIQPHLTSNSEKRILIGADSGDIASNSNIIPNANTAVSLGSSSYQWSSVYAQTYYYNGTQWGLDRDNVWTGANTFKSQNTNLALQSTVSELGSLTAASNWFRWIDKNGAQNAYISRDVWSDGADSLRIAIVGKRTSGAPSTSGTEIDCGVRLNLEADGTKSFTPFDNNISLGTSTNKWKTLNGINPGALSLPSSSYIDISGDITVRDGSTANSLTALCDGWIAINSFATWLQISDDTTLMATTVTPGADGFAQTFLPVRLGDSIRIAINQTNTQFQAFRLIPCLGNV